MNRLSIFIFILTYSFIRTAAFSQEISVEEPEFLGVIVVVSPDGASAQKLEKQKASEETKADVGAALLGITKGSKMNVVQRAASSVRVKAGEPIRLIVRVKDNSIDPAEVVNIFKLTPDEEKERRMLVIGKVNFNKISAGIEFFQFEATKYGESSYLLTLPSLESGEYAATLEGSRGLFNLFGVDEG